MQTQEERFLSLAIEAARECAVVALSLIHILPATLDGYELCQHYLIRREGNFMVELILTGVGEEGIERLLAMFA